MLNLFFKHNWWAILYFNFKMLPFKQAIHIPFDFYGKIRFVHLSGRLKFESAKLYPGIIKIGTQGSDMLPKQEVILSIEGEISIKGRFVFGMGSSLISKKGSRLIIGENTIIGARSLLFCTNNIELGKDFLTSWDCQIMDSDTHAVVDINTKQYNIMSKPIIIGDHVWIGKGVDINKGCCIPPESIVASHSLCNKNYLSSGRNCIFAGSPAKVVSTNKKWIF